MICSSIFILVVEKAIFLLFWVSFPKKKNKKIKKNPLNPLQMKEMCVACKFRVCCPHSPSGIRNKPQLVNILKQIETDISGIWKEKHSSQSNTLGRRTLIMLFY